jgi:soluble lytic murein transglycosylase-like protein
MNTINLIAKVATKVGIKPILLLSICNVETKLNNVNNYKDNNGTSYGIAQIKLNTARDIDPSIDALALSMPESNLFVAAKHLKKLSKKYKTDEEVIAAYNAGGVYYKNGTLVNKKYVDKVMRSKYHFNKKVCFMKGKH